MSTKGTLVDPVRGTASLVRPRYSAGLLLRDDDLTVGVDYTRNLSRLLFRSLFGCGVICGLEVKGEVGCGDKLTITIAPGVALSCSGDPIEVPRSVSVTLDPCCGNGVIGQVWVTLCPTERSCAPRTSACGCDDDPDSVNTREALGYEIRVIDAYDACACGCNPPAAATAPASSKGSAKKAVPAKVVTARPAATGGQTTGGQAGGGQTGGSHDCGCADPCDPCHQAHYAGTCGCTCCDSDCVTLATLTPPGQLDKDQSKWKADHSVRRFIRPVLMRDPQVVRDRGEDLCPTAAPAVSSASPPASSTALS